MRNRSMSSRRLCLTKYFPSESSTVQTSLTLKQSPGSSCYAISLSSQSP